MSSDSECSFSQNEWDSITNGPALMGTGDRIVFVIFFVAVRMPLQLNPTHVYANVLIVVESHSSQQRPVSPGIPSV